MNHKLSIEAPDTLNICQLRLVDTSWYESSMQVKCPQLQVTAPGFSKSFYVVDTAPEFIKNLTACDLGLQKVSCGTVFNPLCDGIYILRWSVSPNDIVYVEYNHLRTTEAMLKVRKILCELDVAGCEPAEKVRATQLQLRIILDDLLAAKVKVEDCGEPKKGMDIYNYCIQRLNKITCRTCI